jgi:hypothetical protein
MKTFVRLAMAMVMVVPIGVAAAAPAGAAAALVTCKSPAGTLAITPSLGAVAKVHTTNINLPVTGCTGPGGVKSGKVTGKTVGTKATTCVQFLKDTSSASLTASITWNNGKTSGTSLKTKASVVKGKLTVAITGKITKGNLFVGKTVTTAVTISFPKGQSCSTAITKIVTTGVKPLVIS